MSRGHPARSLAGYSLLLAVCSSEPGAVHPLQPDGSGGARGDAGPAIAPDGGTDAPPLEPCRGADRNGLLSTRVGGLTIEIDAASLQADGRPPVAPLCFRLHQTVLRRWSDMPGGFRGVSLAGADVVLLVEEVVEPTVTDAMGRTLRLAPGKTIRASAITEPELDLSVWRRQAGPQPWREAVTGPFEIVSVAQQRRYQFLLPGLEAWAFAHGVPPFCHRGVLKNACGEPVPDATIEALTYTDLGPRSGDRVVTDGQGAFQLAGALPRASYALRVQAGGRKFLVHSFYDSAAGTCPVQTAVLPICDGVECYGTADRGGSGGMCGSTSCFGDGAFAYCSDGHVYQRACGGSDSCSCLCKQDDSQRTCSFQPLPCAEQDVSKTCFPTNASCGFPRHVPASEPPPRPCETDADCLPYMPHCTPDRADESYCDR